MLPSKGGRLAVPLEGNQAYRLEVPYKEVAALAFVFKIGSFPPTGPIRNARYQLSTTVLISD